MKEERKKEMEKQLKEMPTDNLLAILEERRRRSLSEGRRIGEDYMFEDMTDENRPKYLQTLAKAVSKTPTRPDRNIPGTEDEFVEYAFANGGFLKTLHELGLPDFCSLGKDGTFRASSRQERRRMDRNLVFSRQDICIDIVTAMMDSLDQMKMMAELAEPSKKRKPTAAKKKPSAKKGKK